MNDLETKLAEERERLIERGVHYRPWRLEGFDPCARIGALLKGGPW